ncbi:MAG: response regulator transcription factor [Eubacterium sp.]|nr:response regulator transcription factor [Eubacterium sp.]
MNKGKKVVLIIEDDLKLREVLSKFLTRNEFEVLVSGTGKEGIDLFFEYSRKIDIILLDGMLPDIDGIMVLKEIRNSSQVPIIMLTARESEEDQLEGLNGGADNYITKPFLMKVLLAHMDKLIDRNDQKGPNAIERGALRLEKNYRKAFLNDEYFETTPKEFELLVYFAENENIVVSRERILNAVWGFEYDGDIRTVDTLVKQLRKKMTDAHPYIQSVYGVGYRFEVKEKNAEN